MSNLSPSVAEFAGLREKIGWGQTDKAMAATSLANSLFHVLLRDQDKLIAMGRVIGDGAMFFYIQDVIVDPDYQQQGLGHIIMKQIESYLLTAAKTGATVGLLAARGKEGFYRRYGYRDRCGETLGLGMCKFV
ncbi:GNAT family N-acetyltransferase [Thalassomonas actiniarum]|uniref:GNAT family N-acetyltransferase n=1 Tax=Thalassomonas actiniarum TaxID=485447 RepID=A0AAF0C4G0_9GAMM|nr:GNAT family N-acetyltransferase [Thalassomonas actiniarum]WDD99923.1 GNAT family N-acetyltransferase [Thalassomonas actiniarum]